jgi:hypothetical protein
VLAGRGQEAALGQVGPGAQRRRADHALELAQTLKGRGGLLELATRDARVDEQLERRGAIELDVLGQAAQQPLADP